jgi:hypothetical protein
MSGQPARILKAVEDNSAPLANVVKCALAADALLSFGTLRFAATGWSMIPTVWPYEMLLVERVSQEQVRTGDVLLLLRKRGLCVHRLVSRSKIDQVSHWIIQGDAMAAPDPPLRDDELLGRVTHVVRRGRRVALSTKLTVGQRALGGIVARSYAAARVLVYLHGLVRTPHKVRAPEKLVVPCQS